MPPVAGATFRERLSTGGLVLAAGSAYVAWAHLPLQQALNGLLAALMFNIIYDVLLSQVGEPILAGSGVLSACMHGAASPASYSALRAHNLVSVQAYVVSCLLPLSTHLVCSAGAPGHSCMASPGLAGVDGAFNVPVLVIACTCTLYLVLSISGRGGRGGGHPALG